MRWRDVLQDSRQAVRAIVTSVRRQLRDAGERWQRTSFSASQQVRVILFRECDRHGRKLLFDSKTVHKSENGSPTKTVQRRVSASFVLENGISYEYSKPSGDLKMLGEMIFGSVAMSFQGATFKVHTIRSPPQLMVSLIFPAPVNSNRQDFDGGSGSLEASTESVVTPSSCSAHSIPVDVPGLCKHGSASELLDSLDQWSVDSSLTHSSSYSSFQRRLRGSVSTSIEYGLGSSRTEGSGSLSERTAGGRKIKLGLGILISFPEEDPEDEYIRFQDFFFSHAALVEGHVLRLSLCCQQAFSQRHTFVGSLLEGTQRLRLALQGLYCSPRLPRSPAWLAMIDPTGPHRLHARHISSQLLSLIKNFDIKNTNFFVSTLLTAVLSGHLSWVSTVAPRTELHQKTPSCGLHQYARRESAQWLDGLAQSHPYNPLWVQLGDLYGAVGFPPKLCRTLVVGKRSEVILRFLYALSYFIRCSDVCDKMVHRTRPSSLDSSPEVLSSSVNIAKTVTSESSDEPKNVVFLLGNSPILTAVDTDQSEQSSSINIVTTPQGDHSLGYGSLSNSWEGGEVKEPDILEEVKDETSDRELKLDTALSFQQRKLYMREYNQLRFHDSVQGSSLQELVLKCEESEDGYHSMEDCPVQSCGACLLKHGMHEMPMPGVQLEEHGLSGGLGNSLLAGVSNHYSPDFCLQGLLSTRGHSSLLQEVVQDLDAYCQASVLGDVQAVTIVADTDTWQVNQMWRGSSGHEKSSVSMSPLVASICDSLLQMEQLRMSPEFCLMHLEDRLQELYFRSRSLAVFLNERPSAGSEQASAILGIHSSDLPLLVAVASTNSSQF